MQALPRCCWQHRLQPEARVRREAESEAEVPAAAAQHPAAAGSQQL